MENDTNYEMKRIGSILLRIAAVFAMIIITIALTIWAMASCGFAVGAVVGGICIVICTAISKALKRSGTANIDGEILPDILKEQIELNEYSPSKHFDEIELRRTGALDGFIRADGGGYVDGTFKGVHFTRCAVSLTDRVTEEIYNTETEMYEQVRSDKTVFSGYIVRTEHNSPQYAGVSAVSDRLDQPAVLRKGQKLWSDNEITIYSAVGENIPLVITNGLSAAAEQAGEPAAAVMTEKYLYVIVSTKKTELTVNMLRSISANRESLAEQVKKLTTIAEKMAFLQNERFAEKQSGVK